MIAPALSRVPRVAAIHDLSCFGRCALTAIIPTLSVMGLQCVPLPTALLSTHTGGFTDLHFVDLTEDMDRIADHFSRLPLHFDAVYSGFLGSERQIDIVSAFIRRHRESADGRAPVLVDPVMGDNGRLYSTYTEPMQMGMRRLCEQADIITPNLTEACFLTGTPWRDTSDMDEESAGCFAAELARKMTVFGAQEIVLTGVPCGERIGTYILDTSKDTDTSCFYTVARQPRSYPGTGDIFASVLLGARMRGDDLIKAARTAADFIHDVIGYSLACGEPTRDGVLLEPMLRELVKP